MRIFKLNKDDPNTHTITNESDFLKLTGKKLPWVRSYGNKNIYFAVCPFRGCSNPVKFVNLIEANRLKNSREPYAAHHPYSVPGLAEYNEAGYKRCPYASNSYSLKNDNCRRKYEDPENKLLIQFLKENFDRIAYLVRSTFKIYFSDEDYKDMLRNFITMHNETIEVLNHFNFPWLFLLSYTCQHLSRTPIKSDSPFITFLEKTIKLKKVDCQKVKGACFISRQDEFTSLSFVVSDFKIKNFGENESIEISLHESNSNGGYPRYLGSFELYIDINFSKKILNKKDWETNQKYLNIAQEELNN